MALRRRARRDARRPAPVARDDVQVRRRGPAARRRQGHHPRAGPAVARRAAACAPTRCATSATPSQSLGGAYVTAEDVGTSARDMEVIASTTRARDRAVAPPRRLGRPEPVDGARRRGGDPRLLRARLRLAVAERAHDRHRRPRPRRRARREALRRRRRDAARHRHRPLQARARRRPRRALDRARRGARVRRPTSSSRARSAACSTTTAARGSARRSSPAPRTTSSPTTTSPTAAAHVSARHGRDAGPAAARRDDAGARRPARRPAGAPLRRLVRATWHAAQPVGAPGHRRRLRVHADPQAARALPQRRSRS